MFKDTLERLLRFKIDEVMEGYHYFIDDSLDIKRKMKFEATWGPASIRDKGILVCPLEGTVSVEGMCESTPMYGYISIDYFNRGAISYSFSFMVNGREFLYEGEKVNIRPWNLLTSHTTCVGTIFPAGLEPISRSVTFFKLKNLFKFLRSFRFI